MSVAALAPGSQGGRSADSSVDETVDGGTLTGARFFKPAGDTPVDKHRASTEVGPTHLFQITRIAATCL